jgi:serine/threonine protein kinase
MDHMYLPGEILGLNADDLRIKYQRPKPIQVKIKRQQRPWTLSCGAVVEIISGPLDKAEGNEHFLKMFDRRGAEQLREEWGVDAWSDDIEKAFMNSVESGAMVLFLRKLNTVPNFVDDTGEDWDDAENEAFLHNELRKCFDAEVATYTRLQNYQGICIPRLLAVVNTNDQPFPRFTLNQVDARLYHKRGILLEYVHGFTLTDVAQHAPKSSWQGIVNKAVETVQILGDHNILNKDVRPDNFMVVPKNDTYQIFMIDFGQCRFRDANESDDEWGRAKWREDEEGAVARVMQQNLRLLGFELEYEPSRRYSAWAAGEDSD